MLLYQNTESDTKTEIVDLDLKQPISAINLEVECTNGSSGNVDNFISDIVTKVEVVNGSDVLVTLNQSQLEAMHYYKTGQLPTMFPSEWANGLNRHNATLFFGRYLWDREYNLDPTKYANPQLKVTFNKAAIRAASATGYATGDNIKLTAVAKVFEDVPAATKFLMQKQINSFTSVSSGEKRVELPTDYAYRMLMLRAYVQGSDIDEVIAGLKISCDTDRFVPLDRKVKQLDAEILAAYGPATFKHDIRRAHGATIRLLMNKEPTVTVINTPNANLVTAVSWEWSSQFYLDVYTASTGATDGTTREWTLKETGHALHATLPVWFGRPMEPGDWFNPKDYAKVEAVLDQNTASAVCELVLEQERPQ